MIDASGTVEIFAGDDVDIPQGTLLIAGTSALIQGDEASLDQDPTFGTTIEITGDVQATNVEIAGGDNLDYEYTRAGSQTGKTIDTSSWMGVFYSGLPGAWRPVSPS